MKQRLFELLDKGDAGGFTKEVREDIFNCMLDLRPLEKDMKVLSGFEPYTQLAEMLGWFIDEPERRPDIRIMVREFFEDLDNIQKTWYNIWCKGRR